MRHLRALPARSDLPTLWDGERVIWQPWTDIRTTHPYHAPPEDMACEECGAVDEPLTSAGLLLPQPGETFAVDHAKRTKSGHEYFTTRHVPAWPVLTLIAARCRHCGHDIGREIWIDDGFDQRWESINKISHTRRQTTLNTGHSMIRVYPAHQVVQVRGRDD